MKKTKTLAAGMIMAAATAVNIFLIIRLLMAVSVFNIIPTRFYFCLILLFAFSTVIPLITIFITLKNKKHMIYKTLTAVSSLLLIVSISVCLLGAHYYTQAADTFREVTSNDSKKNNIGVYTSGGSDADGETVSRYLILKNMQRDTIDKAVEKIEDDKGANIDVEEFDDLSSLMASLEEEGGAALLSTAYVDLFSGIEGGENISESLAKIAEYEVVDPLKAEGEDNSGQKNAQEPFVIYISGIDVWGHITEVSRSDVNILMAVNPEKRQILLVNTPRDYYVTVAGTGGAKDKLTHAGIFGVDVSEETMEMLYGVDIDYYFKLNFSGFEGLIDALGGITVWSDYDFTVEPIKHYVKGNNDLTGLEALAFARERHSFEGGDRQRGINQMNVIQSVVDKLTSSALLKNYGKVMEQIEGTFATDMSMDFIADFVRAQLDGSGEWTIVKYSVDGTDDMQQTYTCGGLTLYVMQPDNDTVAHAAQLIHKVTEGEDISSVLED